MKYRAAILAVVLFFGIAATVTSAAESKAVQTMAAILLHLQHFPTDADKQSLKQITEDKSATKDERTVAQALMGVQHTVAAADKPKLEAIVNDDKAASDKEKLKALGM